MLRHRPVVFEIDPQRRYEAAAFFAQAAGKEKNAHWTEEARPFQGDNADIWFEQSEDACYAAVVGISGAIAPDDQGDAE